jgi:hypothetical protein
MFANLMFLVVAFVLAHDDGKLLFIQDGEVYAAIVIGSGASEKAQRAAQELRDFLQKMTGVRLSLIREGEDVPYERLIVVGQGKLARDAGVQPPQRYPGGEEYRLKVQGDHLFLIGNDAGDYDGTPMAVYHFLEMLGARCYRYDDPKYLIIPKLSEVSVGVELDVVERPAFSSRSLWASADRGFEEARDLWWRWNRLGGEKLFTSHNEFIPRELFNEHPEYFAMIDGKRTNEGEWQYCTTNPDVIRLAADAAAGFFRKNPDYRTYSLSPRDCGGFCQCPECKKLDAIHGGNPAARWVIFANKVREELERRYPQYRDRHLIFYAYWYTKNPPLKIEGKEGTVAMLVGDGCHLHLWEDVGCQRNVRWRALLSGWKSAMAEPVAIYDWYIPGISNRSWERFPWVAVTKPIFDQRFFLKNGVRWVYYETDHYQWCWAYRWVTYYIVARGMWSPKINPMQILLDICRNLYGKAWRTMFEYYKMLDEVTLHADVHGGTWKLPSPDLIYNDGLRRRADELLDEALAETEDDPDPLTRERVKDAVKVWREGWDLVGAPTP